MGTHHVGRDWAPHPERRGWQRTTLAVRGRAIPITYRVEGPLLVKGAHERPLFLLVVKGIDQYARRKRRREPTFWLVSAVPDEAGGWGLPWPVTSLLGWAWQRWEIEVAHRELKSGFGVGEVQCWGARSAVLSVQWTAWALCRAGPGRHPRLGMGAGTGCVPWTLVAWKWALVTGALVAGPAAGTLGRDGFSPGLGRNPQRLVRKR